MLSRGQTLRATSLAAKATAASTAPSLQLNDRDDVVTATIAHALGSLATLHGVGAINYDEPTEPLPNQLRHCTGSQLHHSRAYIITLVGVVALGP
jgi:hypothetical protein